MPRCTLERVNELLSYDPDDGVFRWKASRGSVKAGAVAGTVSDKGYVRINIDGEIIRAHRLAWGVIHGAWPEFEIDHENTVKTDNRFTNLRPATRSQNEANKSITKLNKSGYKGVFWYRRTQLWKAEIRKDGKKIYLGCFSDPLAASQAYEKAALALHGDFARLT
jgi:hypothetical protein